MDPWNKADIRQFSQRLGAALSPPWELTPSDDDYWPVLRLLAGGPSFLLRPAPHKGGRIAVHGLRPIGANRCGFDLFPSITFDPTRPLDRIAADVARRFLRNLLAAHNALVLKIREAEAFEATRLSVAKALATMAGEELFEGSAMRQPGFFINGGPMVSVSAPDSIRFEAFSCAPRVAERIIREFALLDRGQGVGNG